MPTAKILLKASSTAEHKGQILDIVKLPPIQRSIEGRGFLKHAIHLRNFTYIPAINVAVKSSIRIE
jgi:hypothetical protein